MNVLLPAITRFLRLVISGGSSQYDPELGKVTLANFDVANLDKADLTGVNLDDVIGADFIGALNVPAKYLKR